MCGVFYILLGLGVGVYSLWAGLQGLVRGEVVDTGRHHSTTYVRASAPLEYWLTETGLLLCGVFLVMAFGGGLFRKLRPLRTPPVTKE